MEATSKQIALQTIESMPDSASSEDILYKLYVILKVQQGESDIAAGRFWSLEDVMEMSKQWHK